MSGWNRTFSRREKLLLLLLALLGLAGLYLHLVHLPVTDGLRRIESRRLDLALERESAERRRETMDAMEAELEEIFALPPEEITVLPPYDSIRPLTAGLAEVFHGLEPELRFGPVEQEDGIVVRPVDFVFRVSAWEQARAVLEGMTGMGVRCRMEQISLRQEEAESGESWLDVTGRILFYERLEQEGP